jgi:hypothetical protein
MQCKQAERGSSPQGHMLVLVAPTMPR